MDIQGNFSDINTNHQFSWYRGEPINSNMFEDIDIYYCTGATYRAFKINRNIIGDKNLDYRGDYSFLRGGYGIYFLYNIEKTSKGQTIHVYVGKAEDRVRPHGMDRLVEHINNDEKMGLKYANKWSKALYITIKEDKDIPEFTPGVIKALESAFIAMFKGLEQRISEDKKAITRVVCYNVKTGEPSNESLDKYKTHIYSIIALLAHNGIKILPEEYIGAFAAESKVEEIQALSHEINRLNKDLHDKTIEAEEAKQKAERYDLESKELLELRLLKKFKETHKKYSDAEAMIINGRVYTATNLVTMTKSSTVLTPFNIATDMVNLVISDYFTLEDKTLFFYSKDGVFIKSMLDRAITDESLSACGKTPIERLRNFFGHKACIVVPNTDCFNLTMSNIINYYIEKLQQLDPMWAFDVNNCVLPHITIINNLETLVKTIDGRKFIKDRIEKEFGTVKFDVVIGNPPYNNDIYLDFVTLGDQLASKATCMITPAKWQAKGGEKNEAFRKNIVPRMSDIVYYPDAFEIFDVREQEGITYYLIDKNRHTDKNIEVKCKACKAFNASNEQKSVDITLFPKSIEQIINKVQTINSKSIQRMIGVKQSEFVKNTDSGTISGEVAIYAGDKIVGYRNKSEINGLDKLNKFKAVTSVMPVDVGFDKNGQVFGFSKVYNIPPNAVPKGSFPMLMYFNTPEECNSFISYCGTKFIRFLYYIGICGKTIAEEFWRFVPDPGNFDHIFTDKELYDKYNLTPEEIEIIESVIKERK